MVWMSIYGLIFGFLLIGLALVLIVAQEAGAIPVDPIRVDTYSGFWNSRGGTPYSGLVGSFTSPTIAFGLDTYWKWHPGEVQFFHNEPSGSFRGAALLFPAGVTYGTEPAPFPEPTILLIIGSGLIGLWGSEKSLKSKYIVQLQEPLRSKNW
jgi:hypothetical protein